MSKRWVLAAVGVVACLLMLVGAVVLSGATRPQSPAPVDVTSPRAPEGVAAASSFVVEVKPRIGAVYRYAVVEDRTSSRSRAGKTSEHSHHRIVRVVRVEPLGLEGEATLCQLLIESMVHELQPLDSAAPEPRESFVPSGLWSEVKGATYDSQSNQNARLKRERLIDVPIQFLVSPIGEVLDVRSVAPAQLTPKEVEEVRAAWVGHVLLGLFAPYPTTPLAEGDSWDTTLTIKGVLLSLRATNTVAGGLKEGRVVLEQRKSGRNIPGGGYREKKIEATGVAELDLTDGMLLSYRLTEQWSATRLSGVSFGGKSTTRMYRLPDPEEE